MSPPAKNPPKAAPGGFTGVASSKPPGVYLPSTSMRSPTVVPGKSDLKDFILEAKLDPKVWSWWLPVNWSQPERAINRLAARIDDERDRDVNMQIRVSGKVLFSTPIGILYDAYDGRGLVDGSVEANEIVGQFGAILAKMDAVLGRLDQPRLFESLAVDNDLPERRLGMEALGKTMAVLQDALAQLGRPTSSGFNLRAPILVARHDQLEVQTSTPLHGNVRVYLRGVEKSDSR